MPLRIFKSTFELKVIVHVVMRRIKILIQLINLPKSQEDKKEEEPREEAQVLTDLT